MREVEGTQREVDLNAIPFEEAIKTLEDKISMQNLVDLDEKINKLLKIVKKKRDFTLRDKDD